MSARPPLATMVLVTSLFLLGGLMNSLNNVLTGQFKQGFELTDPSGSARAVGLLFRLFRDCLARRTADRPQGLATRRPQREQPTVLPVR